MTIAELQKELSDVASLILFASSTLQEDSGTAKVNNKEEELGDLLEEDTRFEWDGEEETWEEDLELDEYGAAGLLELLGLSYMDLASSLTGDGSHGPYNQFPKPSDFFQCCLLAPDCIFRSVFRMGKHMFDLLHHKISSNSIFQSTGQKPQRPVKYQLGTFLIRYGMLGSDSLDTALKLNIGHGTVFLYCHRVTRAIRELKSSYIGFPCFEDLQETSRIIEEQIGFPRCCGSGDGSLIRFDEKPLENGTQYMGRKHFFGAAVQATVDHRTRITSYEIGWPAAVTDSRIWKQSHFWKHRATYLPDGYYVLVDKGYPSSPYTVRPFSEPELAKATPRDCKRMRDFNYKLLSVRISVEHVFGQLKGRFPSLHCMGPHEDVNCIYRVIEALMILHNMCIFHGDHPESIWQIILQDDNLFHDGDGYETAVIDGLPNNPDGETDASLREAGYRMRIEILDQVFPAHLYNHMIRNY